MLSRQRQVLNRLHAFQLKETVDLLCTRTLRFTFTRIIGEGDLLKGIFKKMTISYKRSLKAVVSRWKEFSISKGHKLKVFSEKIRYLDLKLRVSKLKVILNILIGDERISRCIRKLVQNYEQIQSDVIKKLWHRVEKSRLIRKLNSAHYVLKNFLLSAKKAKATRFFFWKNLEFLRRRRCIRKSIVKMIFVVGAHYETAFWKWKYMLTHTNLPLVPKHSLVFKRIALIGKHYQIRLKQFSLFKLGLHYKYMTYRVKVPIPQTVTQISKYSREHWLENAEKLFGSAFDWSKSIENPSSLSTVASGQLSKDEVHSITQAGCIEMMVNQIKSAANRLTSWGICSIFTYSRQVALYKNERQVLFEQINQLRFEKNTLLEDNNTLRNHNESLIENLEKTNLDVHALSLNLDSMRLVRMVRVLARMIEGTVSDAFLILYQGDTS